MATREGSFSVEDMKNVQINIGAVVKEADEWDQEMGPHPKPGVATLRTWDHIIANRYKIMYAPADDTCTLCTYGPCDLTGNKRGACGIDQAGACGKIVLIACLMGTCAHSAHGRHLYHWCMEKFGDMKFDMGDEILVDSPLYQTIMGTKPKSFKDFNEGLYYLEEGVVQLLAATHTGQESAYIDFESKALHAGMLDLLGMEICDMLQIVAYNMPRGAADAPLIEIGMGTMDQNKGVLIAYGHNLAAGAEAMVYAEENGLWDKVDIGGVCCTAHDLNRIGLGKGEAKVPAGIGTKPKVAGAIGWWRKMVRSGVMDCVMVDEQCVWCDVLADSQKRKIPVIATTDKIMLGLVDRTNDSIDAIVDDLVSFKVPGVAILDPTKAGIVGIKTAIAVKPKRAEANIQNLITEAQFQEGMKSTLQRLRLRLPAPHQNQQGHRGRSKGRHDYIFQHVRYLRRMRQVRAGLPTGHKHPGPIRVCQPPGCQGSEVQGCSTGRGPARDTEIRSVGAPNCARHNSRRNCSGRMQQLSPRHQRAYDMAKEFVDRGYIVVTSGCMAMDMSLYTM